MKERQCVITSVLGRLARIGNAAVTLLTTLLALCMFCYSGYALWDTLYLNRISYASWDLLQYKPSENAGEKTGLEILHEMNPDVIGWLEVSGSNIDYPIVQGTDNLYYAFTDVEGHPSLNGSIYLDAQNNHLFEDFYSVIYGHHIAGGGMFADLEKFETDDFFQSHRTARVTTVSGNVLDMNIFACVVTHAYDTMIYAVSARNAGRRAELMDYIRSHAILYTEEAVEEAPDQIVAMSTCSDTTTDGRIVIFAGIRTQEAEKADAGTLAVVNLKLTERKEVTEAAGASDMSEKAEILQTVHPVTQGHGVNQERFALVNLVAVLLCVYFVFPIGHLRVRYGKRFGEHENGERMKVWAVNIAEILLLFLIVAAFLTRENMLNPLTIIDDGSPILLGCMACLWLIDTLGIWGYGGEE